MARMRALIAAGLGLALILGPTARADAQAEERESVLRTSSPFMDLRRGDRIRVRLRTDDPFRARFLEASPETLSFASDKRLRHEGRIAFQEMEGLDRRTGSHGHALTGAFLGLFGGAALGAAIGAYAGKDDREQGLVVFVCAVGGGAGGLLLGTFAGLWVRSDNWTPVWER